MQGLLATSFRLVTCMVIILATALPSEAARRKSKNGFKPRRYSAIVIDAASGQVLESYRPDLICHPASMTKIMTLYKIFEAIKAGRIKLSTKWTVSKFAAAQAPTKLGLRAGSKVSVKTVIFTLITRSANDMAVTAAESLSGSVVEFSRQMTKTAKRLGMRRTTFVNPSGLPDPRQLSTARDMAILSRSLYRKFPHEYGYFRTKYYKFNRRKYKNHNNLLGRVAGVDGVKTGYTRASGFTLSASAVRYFNHRSVRLIAVVMGGPTASWRDQRMKQLLERNFARYRFSKRTPSIPKLQPVKMIMAPKPHPHRASQEELDRVIHRTSMNDLIQDVVMHSDKTTFVMKPIARSEAVQAVTKAMTRSPATACPAPRPTIFNQDEETHRRSKALLVPKPRPSLRLKPDVSEESKWGIQVGVFSSKQKAARVATSLKNEYELKKGKVITQELHTGRKRLYKAQIGNLSKADSQDRCKALKAKGVDCLTLVLGG